MNYVENKHTVYTKFSQKIYWKGNSACGYDENPDRVELRPASGNWPTLDFRMPDQRFELEKVEQLMLTAYSRGVHDNKAAVGKMLKELIAI